MKELLLTLILLTVINSLHGMEIKVPKKPSPITLPQIYYHLRHLEDFLLPEIVQHIFSLLPGIETINDDLPQIDKISRTIWLANVLGTSIKDNGHCSTVEQLKRNLLRKKISICDVKDYYAQTVLHNAQRVNVIKVILEVADHEVWRLLAAKRRTDNQTALHIIAIFYHTTEQAKLFLDAAGDKAQDLMDIQDSEGKTAFDIASPKIKKLMLQYQKKNQ